MRTIRSMSTVSLMLVALVTVACGKSTSPLAPSPAPTAVSAAPAPASAGATISGVVVSGAQLAGFSNLSSGGVAGLAAGVRYTITVNGTNITVTSNDDGSFVLPNVPTGDLTLTITGPNGFSAQVVIPGVELNEQVRITVRVQGSTAELDDEEHVSDTRAEVEGRIVSVTGDTLVIGARLVSVVVPPGTPIRHGNAAKAFADLVPGVRVHVKASRAGDVLTAMEVKLQNDNQGPSNRGGGDNEADDDDDDAEDEDEDEAELSGAITGAISGSCPNLTFTVAGTVVKTDSSTEFDDVSCSTLKTGDTVKVEGVKQPDNSLLAREVEKKSAGSGGDGEKNKGKR